MNFLSHIKKDKDGTVIYEKEIKVHVGGIQKVVSNSISSTLKRYAKLIHDIVELHDLGKYTSFFQEYLTSGKNHSNNFHFHVLIGACTIYNLLKDEDQKTAIIAYFVIFHHHSNLNDIGECYPDDNKKRKTDKRLRQQYKDLTSHLNFIQDELDVSLVSSMIASEAVNLLIETDSIKDEKNIFNYFLINYLFSLLIEGDKLDASDTSLYKRKYISPNLVNSFISSLDFDPKDLQNVRRSKARMQVLSNLERKDITDIKLFTLTAPTGIGKTLTSLDFALKLRDKIREEKGVESQIIYALPFINIIEQSIEVYEDILPGYVKLQAHYQFSDVFEQTKKYNEYQNYNQKTMQLDTWQSDIVITSFVQFLQTLIGYRNKVLKKFHHLSDSIIILDEVQTLKLGHLPLIGAALYYASEFLNARIILMTATKPLTYELATEKLIPDAVINRLELLNNYEEVFGWFNRTKLIPRFDLLKDEQDFIDNIFDEGWKPEQSCLIVCNTVNRSINVFDKIRVYLSEKGFDNPIYYLSTNIVPIHRVHRINDIKKDLKKGLKPILISTQVVEAGVDLDFDIGFRDLAPLDSIIQVAGRINRSDKKQNESPVYVINFGDCSKIYDNITEKYSKAAFAGAFSEGVAEKDYLSLIKNYFLNVSSESGYHQSRSIFKAMQELKYDGTKEEVADYKTVSSFQVIEERCGIKSIFIEIDVTATTVAKKFRQMIDKKISKSDFESYKKDFHQRIINVPEWCLDGDLENLSDNTLIVENTLIEDYYNLETGFIRNTKQASITLTF